MLVIPEVCRFAVSGTISGRPWVNVFDAKIPEGRPAAEGTIQAIAKGLMNVYWLQVRPLVAPAWIITHCSWVDLNSENGSTGTITGTPEHVFPSPGTKTGDVMPANVAILAVKTTTRGRGMKNGRTFFPGTTEAAIVGNQLQSTDITLWNTACTAIRDAIEDSGGQSTAQMVVAGITKLGVKHANPVTAYAVSSLLATQRRRLRA